MTHYVFSGANHTRFEHCVGTAHLARKMFRKLVKNSQDELCYSDEETTRLENSVLLAGLCHDIGHGPFSHAFDKVVGQLPGGGCRDGVQWSHEYMGSKIVESMAEKYP